MSKFIPNFCKITESLCKLIRKNLLLEWSGEQENSFLKLTEVLENTPKLACFDVNKPTIVSVETNSYAVGAVLF